MTSERRRSESFRGERPNAGQAIGFVVTLGGGIATSLLKDNGSSSASPATEGERNLSHNTYALAALGDRLSLDNLVF